MVVKAKIVGVTAGGCWFDADDGDLNVDANVTNTGDEAAAFRVRFYINGASWKALTTKVIEPGGQYGLGFRNAPVPEGPIFISAKAYHEYIFITEWTKWCRGEPAAAQVPWLLIGAAVVLFWLLAMGGSS